MKETLSKKLYGMKEPPEGLIVFSDGNYIILPNIINFSHCFAKTSPILSQKSKVIISETLLNEDIMIYLNRLTEGNVDLYLFKPLRSYKSGKDEWKCYLLKDAHLIDFKFGTAADGDPSRFTYTFVGDLIENDLIGGSTIHYFDIVKNETEYDYE